MSKTKSSSLVYVMALGTFVVVLDNTIMNVSISALVADLNTSVSGVQAAISLNALMMAAFVLMGGKLGDIIGMRKTFLFGAIMYVTGSLLASLSNNLFVFVLGWCAIQGFGAALMLPNVTSIIRSNVGGSARAQAYGLMAGINALGTAVGPIIGGFLTTYYSWRWAFRLEVFVLLIVLLSSRVIPKDVLSKVRPTLDKIGVVWQAAAMFLLVLGTLLISDYGIFMAKQPFVISGIEIAPFGLSIVSLLWGAGIICLMMFVRHENNQTKNKKDTLVDLKLFEISDFVTGLIIRLVQVALVAGVTFCVPLYLQVTYGLSAFETGIVLLAFTTGLLITALSASKKALNILPKTKIRYGLLISLLGLIIVAIFIYTGDDPRGMMPGIFVYGLGLGLITSQIVNLVMSFVKPEQTAEASGVTSTFDTLGSSLGTAIVGSVLIISLTSGIVGMVGDSSVFPPETKDKITSEMSTSVEIVSDEVISETISEDGAYEQEALTIYNTARMNAFIITIGFMGFIIIITYLLAGKLPDKMVKEVQEM